MSDAPKVLNLTRTLLSQADQPPETFAQSAFLKSEPHTKDNQVPVHAYPHGGVAGLFQPYREYMPSDHHTPTVVSLLYTANQPMSASLPHSASLPPHLAFPTHRPPVSTAPTEFSEGSIGRGPFQPTSDLSRVASASGAAPHSLPSGGFARPMAAPTGTSRSHRPPSPPINLQLALYDTVPASSSSPHVSLVPDHYMSYHEFLLTLPSDEEHLNIVEYPVNDLIMMLSSLLTKIIEANDKLHPNHFDNTIAARQRLKEERLSSGDESVHDDDDEIKNKYLANVLAFHGANVPGISLHAYLARVLKYCPVTNEVFLSLLVYFDRIAKKANNLQHKQEAEQLFVMDSYNIHRLIILGITVSSKFFSDIFYKNLRYAKVGGLPLDELNYLELQFLLLLDFKLMISVEDMQNYGDLLLKFWKREQVAKELLPTQS